MSDVPSELKYTTTHEWIKQEEEHLMRVGVTDHAQHLLGDIVFVELPEVGQMLKQGQEAGVIESVKAASDLYVPISGKVTEINEVLQDKPELVNEDPYEHGWLFKVQSTDLGEWETLLNAQDYQSKIEEEEGA